MLWQLIPDAYLRTTHGTSYVYPLQWRQDCRNAASLPGCGGKAQCGYWELVAMAPQLNMIFTPAYPLVPPHVSRIHA